MKSIAAFALNLNNRGAICHTGWHPEKRSPLFITVTCRIFYGPQVGVTDKNSAQPLNI